MNVGNRFTLLIGKSTSCPTAQSDSESRTYELTHRQQYCAAAVLQVPRPAVAREAGGQGFGASASRTATGRSTRSPFGSRRR